jgi:hypothetical protein
VQTIRRWETPVAYVEQNSRIIAGGIGVTAGPEKAMCALYVGRAAEMREKNVTND